MKFANYLSFSVIVLSTAFFTSHATADAVTVEDVNLDNIPDVVVTETGAQQPKVFLGNGDGTFANATTPADKEANKRAEIAKLMGERKSQVALTLNQDLSFDVLGVRAGKKVKPCSKENPCRYDPNNLNGKGELFAQKTFTITIIKGSCCATVSTGSSTYEYCTPEWPLFFVNAITGEECP